MLVSNLLATLLSLGDNLEAELSRSTREAQANPGQSSPPDRDIAVESSVSGLLLSMVGCYGANQTLLARKVKRLAGQSEEFIRRFGDGPVRILRAPARINILGEHIDYVSYIPTASLTFGSREHDMVIMLRPAAGVIRGSSTDSRFEDFEFHLGNRLPETEEGEPGTEWLAYLYSRPVPAAHWANYAEGACRFAQIKYGSEISSGFDFLIDSSVPPGGGASSSSALCVLAGAAVRLINGISYEPEELALDSSRAEWYVGTRGGSMDHTTILLARPDSAIQISYSNGQSKWVPLSSNYSWITFFTHAANKGQEVMSEYNDRALVSRIVIPAIVSGWDSTKPRLSRLFGDGLDQFSAGDVAGLESIEAALRELPESADIGHIQDSYPTAFEQGRQAFPALIDSPGAKFQVRKRALHHIGEVKRVARGTEVLLSVRGREEARAGSDREAAALIGSLLQESHSSLRDLYEVSSREVEELVEIIEGSGLAFGARMMGGGFGGNVLALVAGPNSAPLIKFVQREYYSPRNRDALQEGSVMISTAGPGLNEIKS